MYVACNWLLSGEQFDTNFSEKFHYFFLFLFFFLSLSSTTKVVISGIPHHANFSDVEPLLKQYGNVEECDAVASKDPKTQTVHITFESYEQAQRLLTQNSSFIFNIFLQTFYFPILENLFL